MKEKFNEIVVKSGELESTVNTIIGDNLTELDNYMDKVRACFLSDSTELTNAELDKIILQIPVYVYYLITILQKIELAKGVTAETAKYREGEQILIATGTVAEKQAKASNNCIKERFLNLAYKTAAALVQSKINAAMEILSSAKKVEQRRLEEMKLTKLAGDAVSNSF